MGFKWNCSVMEWVLSRTQGYRGWFDTTFTWFLVYSLENVLVCVGEIMRWSQSMLTGAHPFLSIEQHLKGKILSSMVKEVLLFIELDEKSTRTKGPQNCPPTLYTIKIIIMLNILTRPGLEVIKPEFSQTQNKAQWLAACGHISPHYCCRTAVWSWSPLGT